MRLRLPAVTLIGLIGSLAISGCAPPTVGNAGSPIGTIKLGIEVPLSGEDASDGTSARNGVQLAIDESGPVCGASSFRGACFRLQIASLDDAVAGIHDPAKGAKDVQVFAGDDQVAGVIGPLYDSLARSELPIANTSHLVMISPANTDVCLTQEPADGHCHNEAERLRPHGPNNYFRVVTTRAVEGAAAADLASKSLGIKHPYLVYDETPSAKELANAFAAEFAGDGGFALGPAPAQDATSSSQLDPWRIVEEARSLHADSIFFAGANVDIAAQLRRDMFAVMPNAPLIGGDSLANNQFAKSAGPYAVGSYYTVVGPYAPGLPHARAFISAYQRKFGPGLGLYSLQAFDAANLLIDAVRRAIDDAHGKLPARDQMLYEVARTKRFQAAMGVISFDARGDTSLKLVTAYEWTAASAASGKFAAEITVQ